MAVVFTAVLIKVFTKQYINITTKRSPTKGRTIISWKKKPMATSTINSSTVNPKYFVLNSITCFFHSFNFPYHTVTRQQHRQRHYAKRTVYQPPENGNPPYLPSYKRKREDSYCRYHAKFNNPAIFKWVF